MVLSLWYPAFLSVLLTSLHAFEHPSVPAIQNRATYPGGWALAPDNTASVCPSGTTKCGADKYASCCPSNQFCFGSYDSKYCCPTDEKCDTLMVNLSPICANSTWDMFDLNGHKSKFFCCHPGFIGVKPKYYGPGLCLEADQKVSPTQLATPVSQDPIEGPVNSGNSDSNPVGGDTTTSGSDDTNSGSDTTDSDTTDTDTADAETTKSSGSSKKSEAGVSAMQCKMGVLAGIAVSLSVHLLL